MFVNGNNAWSLVNVSNLLQFFSLEGSCPPKYFAPFTLCCYTSNLEKYLVYFLWCFLLLTGRLWFKYSNKHINSLNFCRCCVWRPLR